MKKIFILTALFGCSLGWLPCAGAAEDRPAAGPLPINTLPADAPMTNATSATPGRTNAPNIPSGTTNAPNTTPGRTNAPNASLAAANAPATNFPDAAGGETFLTSSRSRTASPAGRRAAGSAGQTDTLSPPTPQGPLVTIRTTLGTMKLRLYADVPGHTQAFLARARSGAFNGTLFTRVIREFMIQGGAPDSKNAPAGARCGFGDASAEIPPELKATYFHKRGALAAPRQNDDINPERKSDMSQFFIVQGKVYRPGELDTLERIQNQAIRKKALDLYYRPVRVEMQMLKHENPREFNKRAAAINRKIDSLILATPGHLIFTPEQREAYTTVGGCHFLDGTYTVFGELVEGFDVLDAIASQPKDRYDRPLKDVRILGVE